MQASSRTNWGLRAQIASKLCNGAFGGAPGVNSVATDGVNYYTGKADARTAAEHAFQVQHAQLQGFRY